MEISNRCREIVLGSLLGDGSLRMRKNYNNARLEIRHSVIQQDYFFWKIQELQEISGDNCYRLQPADGWSKNKKLHYHSRSNTVITEIYNLTHYDDGNISFNRKWLKLLTPLSLLIWWLDDGSLVKNSRQGIFCTEGFNRDGVLALSNHLKKKWGIETNIGRRGKYYQLRIYSTENLKKFFRLVLPHFAVPSMLPKVILLYKDTDLQKRWISEVSELTKIPISVVEQYTKEKSSRWKSFRE